jgi:hypothetical protein
LDQDIANFGFARFIDIGLGLAFGRRLEYIGGKGMSGNSGGEQ